MPTISLPMSPAAWCILLAVGILLAALGTGLRDRPVLADRWPWLSSAATASAWTGRALTVVMIALFVGGERFVHGGLHF